MASSSESATIASEICSATGVGDLGVEEYCSMRRLRSSRSISSGSGIGTVVVVVVVSCDVDVDVVAMVGVVHCVVVVVEVVVHDDVGDVVVVVVGVIVESRARARCLLDCW